MLNRIFVAAALGSTALCGTALAQEFTIKLHHFQSAESPTQKTLLEPWEKAVEEQSGGRIDVQVYPSMQLGGKAPQLYDQARDGVVDASWTLLAYTPGRFPNAEVFELPFISGTSVETTMALQEFAPKYLAEELGDVHPILIYAPASYKLHLVDKQVMKMEDLDGLKVRVPSRGMTEALNALGASAVGMPVPEVAQAMTTGVINGAVIPWEVFGSLRIGDVAKDHTEMGQEGGGMSTSVFAFVMNKAKYDALPDDLKKVIDDNSGMNLAQKAATALDEAEAAGRQAALDGGATINIVPEEELARWKETTRPVVDAWVEATPNGAEILKDAEAMMAKARGQ